MSFSSLALGLWPSYALPSQALGSYALGPTQALALALQGSPALAQALALALNPGWGSAALNPAPALSPSGALNPAGALFPTGALSSAQALALALPSSSALALNPAAALALASASALSATGALALPGSPALAPSTALNPSPALPSSPALAAVFGGGGGTATGYFSGYAGLPRSGYATAADLGPVAWAPSFNKDKHWTPFPTQNRALDLGLKLRWGDSDWDPGLRAWTAQFPIAIEAWLQGVDQDSLATLIVRELAEQYDQWKPTAPMDPQPASTTTASACRWIKASDLKWHNGSDETRRSTLDSELFKLEELMRQERPLFLEEAWVQSDAGLRYFVHMLGMDGATKPWTRQLMECGLAVAKVVYMHYKAYFRRVRPSTLCAGLVPPWGPPAHPAFPSGHATATHFVALLLLEIEPVAQRLGYFEKGSNCGVRLEPKHLSVKAYGEDLNCPLLWLANRMARNRERIGVHYESDSSAGRSIAIGLWEAIFRTGSKGVGLIALPTLARALALARSEWAITELGQPPVAGQPVPTPRKTVSSQPKTRAATTYPATAAAKKAVAKKKTSESKKR
jgi:hypothetical protein